jgi:PhoPQ-activated pathogenicity-related protein
VDTIGRTWKDSPIQSLKRGEWVVKVAKPDTGWSAYFVELTYPMGGKYPMKVTTAVRVVPDALPYPPFEPKR